MTTAIHRADVWVWEVRAPDPASAARCEAVLSPRELDRMRRFRFEEDRDAYRAAHALARTALSFIEPAVAPQAWLFEESARGRPEIVAGRGFPRLRFNISHTRGLVACIVTRELDCGVDVEPKSRGRDMGEVARAVLTPAELASMAAAAEAERPALFCRYWTLKEAYAKALGLGLAAPFDRLEFEFLDGAARLVPPADEWHFEQWSPTPAFTAATAVRASGPVRLVRHSRLPEQL